MAAPLRNRQNRGGFAPAGLHRVHEGATPRGRRTSQPRGHVLHGRAGEEDRCRKRPAERVFDVDQQLGRLQRIAELEELPVGARRRVEVQDSLPDRTELALDVVGRLDVDGVVARGRGRPVEPQRRGQLRTLDLARSAPRQCRDDDHSARHLVPAQPLADEQPQLRGGHHRPVAQHDRGADVLAQPGVRDRERRPPRRRRDARAALSTSRGAIFSPPRLMISLSRPVMVR